MYLLCMDWGNCLEDRGLAKSPSSDSPVGMALGNVIVGHPVHRVSGSETDGHPSSGAQVAVVKGLSNSVWVQETQLWICSRTLDS